MGVADVDDVADDVVDVDDAGLMDVNDFVL